MPYVRSTQPVVFAASAVLSLLIGAAAPTAAADSVFPSTHLTSYQLVSAGGLCLSTGPLSPTPLPDVNLAMKPCDPASAGQAFYILDGDSDTNADTSGNPTVRIALAAGYDKVPNNAYNYLVKKPGPTGPTVPSVVLGYLRDQGAPATKEFILSFPYGQTPTWVPVGAGEGTSFPVAGVRVFRFGPLPIGAPLPSDKVKKALGTRFIPGTYAYREVDGDAVGGQGSCDGKFFSSPDGLPGASCAVFTAAPGTNPMQLQVFDPNTETCMIPSSNSVDAPVIMGSCNAGSNNSIWQLLPTKFSP